MLIFADVLFDGTASSSYVCFGLVKYPVELLAVTFVFDVGSLVAKFFEVETNSVGGSFQIVF